MFYPFPEEKEKNMKAQSKCIFPGKMLCDQLVSFDHCRGYFITQEITVKGHCALIKFYLLRITSSLLTAALTPAPHALFWARTHTGHLCNNALSPAMLLATLHKELQGPLPTPRPQLVHESTTSCGPGEKCLAPLLPAVAFWGCDLPGDVCTFLRASITFHGSPLLISTLLPSHGVDEGCLFNHCFT